MKILLFYVLALCACATSPQQVTLEPSTQSTLTVYKTYNPDKEMRCAEAMVNHLYENAEKFGNEFFVFTIPPSEVLNWYMHCVKEHKHYP